MIFTLGDIVTVDSHGTCFKIINRSLLASMAATTASTSPPDWFRPVPASDRQDLLSTALFKQLTADGTITVFT